MFGSKDKVKPVVLLVLDGFGLAPDSEGNAITLANTPNYDRMRREYPNGMLIAAGESVGLPANEVGNTEVGHLTMGAGRVIYQDLVRIDKAVASGTLGQNPAFMNVMQHVQQNGSKLHLMGLIGTGQVHSSMNHLYGLLSMCKTAGMNTVRVHAFTDGRDSHPQAGLKVATELDAHLNSLGVGKMASVMGRYYAMDRDRRWERTKTAYEALVMGVGDQGNSVPEVLHANYETGTTDEFIKPTLMVENGAPVGLIEDGDGVIFFNFRVDRPKQLTTALILRDFESFRSYEAGFDEQGNLREVGKPEFEATFQRQQVVQNLYMVTMTNYHDRLPVSAVAFDKQQVLDSMPAVVAGAGLQHLHAAESEKERFVKYYMNGMVEEDLQGQVNEIVKSPKVATYDKKPEMSVHTLVKKFKKQLGSGRFSLAVMNFANPDMVAHTGNLEATVKAIEHVDSAVGEVEKKVLELDGTLLITADHGNAEDLKTFSRAGFFYTSDQGGINTEHSDNPVPVIIINNAFRGKPIPIAQGTLADLAPTILTILGLPVPGGMTGRDLLNKQIDPQNNP